ncbi:PAS domain S-box-containing protein [Stigmatella aurantiaca]|uniref:histidine kinase n=1 Tax=Stigmatella aurantiaca TaxID=41 RepID=A0A1H7TKS2_STIAU|nr:PAS domain S-box-containing protein [Stigmatella aurantiaca]
MRYCPTLNLTQGCPLGQLALPGEEWLDREVSVQENEKSPAHPSLIQALLDVHLDFTRSRDSQRLLQGLLGLLLAQTGSEYGFIGEVFPAAPAPQRVQVLVSHPPTWKEALPVRELLDSALVTGEPTVGQSTPGAVLDAVPPVQTFLALPLRVGPDTVGMVGIANRPGGYDAGLACFLQPVRAALESFLMGERDTRRKNQALPEDPELRRMLLGVEQSVWSLHIPSRELHMSRRLLEILGYAESEVEPTANAWWSMCHPDDRSRLQRLFAEISVNPATPLIEFEYRARRKDGSWAHILNRARAGSPDERGRPTRVMGIDVDITTTKRGEERMSALLRALPDLIFRMRSDGTYLDFSCSTPEETLVPAEYFLGRNIRDLQMPREIMDLTMAHLEHAIREGGLDIYEYEMDMPRGRQSYETRLVRSGPDEAVAIVRNVTERKLAEHRQTQLIRAEKLASLGQLAAGVAHEVTNPVSYVISNLSTLSQYVSTLMPVLRLQEELSREHAPDAALLSSQFARLRELWSHEDLEYLLQDMPEMIEESLVGAQRIKEIIQSLRTFSRADDAKPQRADLNEELESSLRMVWSELKYKCEVKRDFAPLPPVTCYPTQLNQVFTNLLVNAAHAIETRGEIRVRTWQEGDEVVVQISDTGRGMSADTLARIFTPFFTTKPRGQGTGLGLSISYDIISRHEGRIDVKSAVNQGTTFTIHLPISPP